MSKRAVKKSEANGSKQRAAAEVRRDRIEPVGGKWSQTHWGEWPEGFGPGHPDYDDGDGEW